MKKWIHASIQSQAQAAAQARRKLAAYDKEKVDYVQRCYDDVLDAISDSYSEDYNEDAVNINIGAIKTDWLVSAIEDDLMTEEEFNEIYSLLETVGADEANAWA